ncbi:MAG: hypothetical protein ABFD07_18775 [Methanobacterium sp.]
MKNMLLEMYLDHLNEQLGVSGKQLAKAYPKIQRKILAATWKSNLFRKLAVRRISKLQDKIRLLQKQGRLTQVVPLRDKLQTMRRKLAAFDAKVKYMGTSKEKFSLKGSVKSLKSVNKFLFTGK